MNIQNHSQKSLRLSQVTRLSFGAIVVIMVGIGMSARYSMRRLVTTSEWVSHTYAVKADLANLEKKLVDAETGQRGFLFTDEEDFLQPYNQSRSEFDTVMVELKGLIQDNPKQKERLTQVEGLAKQKYDELARTIELKRSNKAAELKALVLSRQGKQTMDEIRTLLNAMIEDENTLLKEREADAKQAVFISDLFTLGGTLTGLAFAAGALVLISRQVISQIHRVADDLATSSSEMASTVQEQESIAQYQAVAVQETNTTMEELNASSRQSAEQADFSATAAKQVMQLAGLGTEAVQHTLEDMNGIRGRVEVIAKQALNLREQAKQIVGITELVSDLASQTNMLALNVAVEAVRAGESGKGFSVIAVEIRKLADHSKVSANKIAVLVDEIQSAIANTVATANDGRVSAEQGAQTVQGTAETFVKVTDAIHDVVNSSEQISLNARQQALAIQQVVDAMSTLNRDAIRNASGISQTRVSAERLNQAVTRLQSVV